VLFEKEFFEKCTTLKSYRYGIKRLLLLHGFIRSLKHCQKQRSNIAEGCGRNSKAVFANFLDIAIGSSYELETQIILSGKLSYFNEDVTNELLNLTNEVQKMLNGLNNSVRQS
jgi:hypothetical protein